MKALLYYIEFSIYNKFNLIEIRIFEYLVYLKEFPEMHLRVQMDPSKYQTTGLQNTGAEEHYPVR